MNKPVVCNLPDRLQNDGMRTFTIALNYKSGTPVISNGAIVKMQLKDSVGRVVWWFSSTDIGDHGLTITNQGVIQFPEIKSLRIPASKYSYDLQVTEVGGFVRTYLKGSWVIKKDITR